MIRNVCTDTAAADTNIAVIKNKPAIPSEYADDFLKAMEIGYYKEFYRQGLISADELEMLLSMQKHSEEPHEITMTTNDSAA